MQQLESLITALSKLPGFGKRSARRTVLHLAQNKQEILLPLINLLQQAADNTKICSSCGNIDTSSPCKICSNPKRSTEQICVVETVADLWAIERSNFYRGQYHVLGGTLSAIDGIGPEDLNITSLVNRVLKSNKECDTLEIILATNATVDGQTTAHYITEKVKDADVKISRIAHGIPVGGELDYLDDGTLGTALKARTPF